jgi:tetratricopeptide (TPR) repeat protein/TolB-like protein
MATSAGNLKSATQVLGRIAGYELLEQVGRGGMGVVFRARDPNLDKIVAIKILPDERARDAEYRARFLREARTEASIDHPLIACCFSIGEADLDPPDLIPSATQEPPLPRKLYLTMEFIPGSDLSALVHGEPLAIERVLDLAGQIAEGLEVAHAAGVVHRDIKPANVRVTPDGRVKLLDFGLAAIIPKPNSKTDSFKSSIDRKMGTCHFMSPEQTNGRTIDPRTDLFSLGVVLYLLVTGRLPFTGETPYEVEDAIRHTEPPPMARYANGVSAELERITKKLLAKDASNRYQSAHEVHTDLVLLGKGPIAPEPESFAHRALLIAFGAVLVLIAAWAIWRIFVRPPWHALAVVPFVNRTGDPRLDYLGDGIAANLIGSLFRGSRLSVAAASTVQKIVPSERTARNLKHELGVDAMLAGSLSKRDELLHLDLELVEGGHGFVIWAASYDYDLAASDDVERQIVRDLTRKVSGPSGGQAPPRPTKPHPGSAYDRVLRAWSALDDPDDAMADRALAYVAEAVEQDPDFALAWACRSRVLWKIWIRDRTEESPRLAEEAANRAVRLDPELLEARLARAQVYRGTGRYAAAIRELSEVLKINPNWDEAELQLAAAYRDAGDLVNAESHFRHTTEVRPRYWRNWNSLGDLRFLQRADYAGAREAYGRVIDLVPEKNIGYTRLAAVETVAGHYEAAIELYEKLRNPVEDGSVATNIGTAYFFTHQLEKAKRFYDLASRLEPRNINVWMNLGDLHARAGRLDSAQVCYEYALQLAGDQLRVNPRGGQVQMQRILCLAKLGRCDEVRAAFATRVDTLAVGNAELTHKLAKVLALCGPRTRALETVRKAVELGISPVLLRDEDELASLRNDPAFPKVLSPKTR